MTTDEPPTPRLPIEVIERVIDSVQSLMYEDDDVYRVDLYPVWKACALTCRAMVPRSQYWLFRNIILSKQSQADNLREIIRRNPIVAQHTRELTIDGPPDNDSKVQYTWISWIPLLLAPRMTNLNVLWLSYDIFSRSHPSFPMFLTAFKSIRRLDLFQVEFSTFARCSRLIQAFPRLDHLGSRYPSWKRQPLLSFIPQQPARTRCRKLQIAHLNLWSNTNDDSDLHEFTEWFKIVQDDSVLRTLNLEIKVHGSIPKILHCGIHLRSIFLQLRYDGPVLGFENLPHLQTIHVQDLNNGTLPIQAVSSMIPSMPSRQIQELVVYIDNAEEGDEGKGDTQGSDSLEAYGALDDALCKPNFQRLEFTLCLLRAPNAVEKWRERLSLLLPKFVVLGRIYVRSIPISEPIRRWRKERDGF